MKAKFWKFFVILILADYCYAAKMRGSILRVKSGSWFGGKKKVSDTSGPKVRNQVKPSLPVQPTIKKETAKTQHSAPHPSTGGSAPPSIKKETSNLQQSAPHPPAAGSAPPPPGWKVPGQQNTPQNTANWKNGYQTHGAPPPNYPHHNAAPPGYNGHTSFGAPPPYSSHGSNGYGGIGHHPQQGSYGSQHGYNPHYGGIGGGYGGMGGGYGGMGGGYGGMGGGYGGMGGGYGGMGGGYGGMGGGFGGMGGGGFSPFGGYGGGGFPMKQKSSFFSGSTVSNVLAGMFVYSMASKLIGYGLGYKRPYTVVNYYNQEPDKKIGELALPANVLVLCEGNSTDLCGQGTQSVCTQNGTVLCVATMNQASPCNQNGDMRLCVNTTVPCADSTDPLCQNVTQTQNKEAQLSVPCFTNLTLDVNLADQSQTKPNTKYTYCITTMAIAGPEYKLCDEISNSNDYQSILNGNYEWFLESNGFRRNYSIYNYDKPMETNGEINIPLAVLTKCDEGADKICVPGTIPTCTTFREIMCLIQTEDSVECPDVNATCVKYPCPTENNQNQFCQNKTEDGDNNLYLPCFTNININAPIPKFNLLEFNGTLPDLNITTSYTYHFNYFVQTLALPGTDSDLCITKEEKEKQEKQQGKQ